MKNIESWEPSGGGSFSAAVIVVSGGLIAWESVTRARGLASAAELCMLAAAIAILVSAIFFYVHWHIVLGRPTAWLVTVAAAFAVQQVNWFMMIVEVPPHEATQTAWAGAFQVLVTAGLGVLLVNGDRIPVRIDPLGAGVALGLALVLLRAVIFSSELPGSSRSASLVTVGALVTVGLWNARQIARAQIFPHGLQWRLAVTAIALSIGQSAAMAPLAPTWVLVASIAANTVGGALMIGISASVAKLAVLDESAAVRVLSRRLKAASMDLHSDQARLHEIRATLAGISCATDLVRRAGISQNRRYQLQEMTMAELQRLQRLVSATAVGAPGPVELDATLRPLVVRHQTEGLPVRWQPTGHVAIGRADDVAEIVNVLLTNARRHAGGRPVDLTLATVGGRVELTVRDGGPGVSPAVRSRLFKWGASGPGSPGEGVGLATAHILAEEMGGELRLEPVPGAGAVFVLSLPVAELPVLQDEQS